MILNPVMLTIQISHTIKGMSLPEIQQGQQGEGPAGEAHPVDSKEPSAGDKGQVVW